MIPHSAGFLLVWTPLPSPTMGLFGFFISGMFWLGPSSLSLDSVIYSHGTNYHLYTHHFPSLPSAQVSISPELCVCLPLHFIISGTLQTQHFQNWVTISTNSLCHQSCSASFPQCMAPSFVRLLKNKPESSLILATPSLSHTHSIKKPW